MDSLRPHTSSIVKFDDLDIKEVEDHKKSKIYESNDVINDEAIIKENMPTTKKESKIIPKSSFALINQEFCSKMGIEKRGKLLSHEEIKLKFKIPEVDAKVRHLTTIQHGELNFEEISTCEYEQRFCELSEIFKDKDALEYFEKFLIEIQGSVELVYFINEVNRFKISQYNKFSIAKSIFDRFIQESKTQINIEGNESNKKIKETISTLFLNHKSKNAFTKIWEFLNKSENVSDTIFDDCVKDVLFLLKSNCYANQFVKSQQFKLLVQKKKLNDEQK